LFLVLSLEESVGIHERVSSNTDLVPVLDRLLGGAAPAVRDLLGHGYRYSWIAFYAPVIIFSIALLLYFVITHFRRHERVRRIMSAGVAAFGLVILAEAASKSQDENATVVNGLMIVEEALELVGASLFAYGFLTYLEMLLDAVWRGRGAPLGSMDD
jgi:hypothetical protein